MPAALPPQCRGRARDAAAAAAPAMRAAVPPQWPRRKLD
jgi:hypothetical protein